MTNAFPHWVQYKNNNCELKQVQFILSIYAGYDADKLFLLASLTQNRLMFWTTYHLTSITGTEVSDAPVRYNFVEDKLTFVVV